MVSVLAGFGNAAADDTSLASRQKRRRQVANLADFLTKNVLVLLDMDARTLSFSFDGGESQLAFMQRALPALPISLTLGIVSIARLCYLSACIRWVECLLFVSVGSKFSDEW